MKSRFLRPLIFTLTLSLSLNAVEDPELGRILKAHVDAMGGWRAWTKVESIRLTGTIERDGQEVDFCIIKKRPNQIRATITMPIPGNEEEFVQLIRAHDGKKAWTATRLAGGDELNQKPLNETAAKDLLNEAAVLPKLIHVWQKGATLEFQGSKLYENRPHYRILAKEQDHGHSTEFLLDQETLTLSYYRTSSEAEIVSQTTLSGYREQDEVLIPAHTEIDSSKTGRTLIHVQEVTLGVGIYEDYFEAVIPAENMEFTASAVN